MYDRSMNHQVSTVSRRVPLLRLVRFSFCTAVLLWFVSPSSRPTSSPTSTNPAVDSNTLGGSGHIFYISPLPYIPITHLCTIIRYIYIIYVLFVVFCYYYYYAHWPVELLFISIIIIYDHNRVYL